MVGTGVDPVTYRFESWRS